MKSEKIQESGKIIDDFWKPAVKLIGDGKFVDMLVNFDASEISGRTFRLLEEKIMTHEDFDSDKIKSYSSAAESNTKLVRIEEDQCTCRPNAAFSSSAIFRWISVVYELNKVTKMDSDVRVNLSVAEDDYEKAKLKVVEKEKILEQAKTKRENLLGRLDQVKEELGSLESGASNYARKNVRASELIKILGSKKNSWICKKRKIEEKCETLIGKYRNFICTRMYFTTY